MNVPQELLDEILRHLPSDEGRSLKSCSLVSKYWLEPSRRLLFASIRINHDNFKLWLERVPPTNTRLLFYVRSLTYFLRGSGTSGFGSVYVFRDYFPSFCQLQNLTLCHLHIEPTIPERLHMFSAFQHTLTSLSFGVVSITWGAFVALVGYFSNLRNLSLLATSFRMDEKPAPRIARPGRGKLFIDLATKAAVSFPHHRFADLRPEYEELEILGAYEHRLVSAVERTLKSLKIGLCGSNPGPGLSHCPELCRLTVAEAIPQKDLRTLISSITSTNFRRLVIIAHPNLLDSLGDRSWIPFDTMICGLVDRLRRSGYKNTMEVELRAETVTIDSKAYYKEFLPKFQEKGRVRIVETSSGTVREWPRMAKVGSNLEI